MWRTIIAVFAAALLSLAMLAACETDRDEDPEDVADDAISLDDEPATPDEDRTAADDEEVVEEDDDAGAARTDDDDSAQGQAAGEEEGEDGPEHIGELTDVTLVDYEIEMESTLTSGIISFGITNEGDETHGISIVPANGNGEEEDIVGTMTVDAGQTEQLELELAEGDYIVFCPINDHREEHGMETEITVE